MEIVDLAHDFIGPLFTQDDKGVFYELGRFFNPLFSESEETFERETRRFILYVIRQEVE